jgi:hypothetical protein
MRWITMLEYARWHSHAQLPESALISLRGMELGSGGGKNAVVKFVSPLVVGFAVH